jgi:hypothetical protein
MAATLTDPTAARTRLIHSLHPSIREFVLAVDELRAAWAVRDLERCERLMRKVEAREAAYLEEWER